MSAAPEWIFIFGAVSQVGGSEARMAETAFEMRRRGIHVTALLKSDNSMSPLLKLLHDSCSDVANYSTWTDLLKYLRRRHKGMAIAFGLKTSMVSRIARFVGGSLPVLTARNGLDYEWRPWMHVTDRLTSRWSNGYLVNSDAVKQHLIDHGASASNIFVVRSALSKEWTTTSHPHSGTPVVAMIGNNRPEKNHRFGIESFIRANVNAKLKIYTNDGGDLKLAIIGNDNIKIIEGHRLTPSDYDAIDIILMPSLSESIPKVVLEAKARGCRVVASDVGDISDYLEPDYDVIVPTHDPLAWERAVRESITQIDTRRQRRSVPQVRTSSEYTDELLAIERSITAREDERRHG